ncbi:hypothetical protein E2C01_030284 [Portunus trituberculatus]|uniref:Uncharacterized protein n=1 Tax=Portunus trituberculatus TaxID=210409 RepID=A0A5B7EUB9_PORTR|nr:hypothetical protein [Portunus trituberculatus]
MLRCCAGITSAPLFLPGRPFLASNQGAGGRTCLVQRQAGKPSPGIRPASGLPQASLLLSASLLRAGSQSATRSHHDHPAPSPHYLLHLPGHAPSPLPCPYHDA